MTVAKHRGLRLDVEKRINDALQVGLKVRQPNAGPVVDISAWTFEAHATPEGGAQFVLAVDFRTNGTDGRLVVSATAAQMAAITWAGQWELRRTDGEPQTIAYGRIIMEDDNA